MDRLAQSGCSLEAAAEDPRLRVVIKDDLAGVGAAKRYACSLALGEFLVELDHDDELRSDALQLIVEAFDAHPQVGFVFSDFAQINEDGSGTTRRFDLSNGWVYEETTVDGRSMLRCRLLGGVPAQRQLHLVRSQSRSSFPAADVRDDRRLRRHTGCTR